MYDLVNALPPLLIVRLMHASHSRRLHIERCLAVEDRLHLLNALPTSLFDEQEY